MRRLSQILVRLHIPATVLVLLGLAVNGLDLLELVRLDSLGEQLSWCVRMVPLLLGSGIIIGAYMIPEE